MDPFICGLIILFGVSRKNIISEVLGVEEKKKLENRQFQGLLTRKVITQKN